MLFSSFFLCFLQQYLASALLVINLVLCILIICQMIIDQLVLRQFLLISPALPVKTSSADSLFSA